jgi:dihydrofolate reductase
MADVVLKMHVSLDGFVGTPEGDVEWVFADLEEETGEWEVQLLRQAGVHVMGRSLYGDIAAHWPTSEEQYAAPMNEIPKVVFSSSLADPEWGETRVDSGPLGAGIAKLREETEGTVLVHGGAGLARSLSAKGLIDTYQLIVHPVALGDGLPIFGQRLDLALVGTRSFPGGAVLLTCRRA